MIKAIKLKQEDMEVITNLESDNIVLKYLETGVFNPISNSTLLLLNKEQMDIVEDELLKLLQAKGITNGVINSFGKKIDNTIDKFNHWDDC